MAAYNRHVNPPEHVKKMAEAELPTRWGKFRIFGFESSGLESLGFKNQSFESPLSGALQEQTEAGRVAKARTRKVETAVALVMGDIHSSPPLVRVHSQCLTGDVFGSLRCDCRLQLEMALQMIAEAGAGVLVYEQQEGRGIGLMAKLQAYELQDNGMDTVEANEYLGFKADCREYALPVEVLKALNLKQIRLLSNNPEKVAAVERAGIRVVERVPCEVLPNSPHAETYLKTKKDKMGHLFNSR